MKDLDQALQLMMNRTAEYKAFEATLRELNQTMVNLLARLEKQQSPQMPDLAPLVEAIARIQPPNVTVPAPQVQVIESEKEDKPATLRITLERSGRNGNGQIQAMTVTRQ